MGNTSNARLKKYITEDVLHTCFGSKKNAKEYIRNNCHVRWILEDDLSRRGCGALEGYFTARLFPKYGIYEEH